MFSRIRCAVAVLSLLGSLAALAQPRPDIQPQRNITLGGRATAWGGEVDLGRVTSVEKGRCAVTIDYSLIEQGRAITTAYINRFRVGSEVAGGNDVPAGRSRRLRFQTQLLLPPGRQSLTLRLDDANTVAESDEANNTVSLRYNIQCTPPKPDLAASGPVRISNLTTPWNGPPITLSASRANAKKDGWCRFPIDFNIVNQGLAPAASPFTVQVVENKRPSVVTNVPSLAVNATRRITGNVWLRCCETKLRVAVLHIDAERKLDDADRATNRYEMPYRIQGKCD